MASFEVPNGNHGQRAVEALAKDVAYLAAQITGKSPENINFELMIEYLELLKNEAERVQQGIYAKDNSILYTCGGEFSFKNQQKKIINKIYIKK